MSYTLRRSQVLVDGIRRRKQSDLADLAQCLRVAQNADAKIFDKYTQGLLES
jgi:hypothetical protein